jgi:pimeloyl-ACP methyl ester carboxylesterase
MSIKRGTEGPVGGIVIRRTALFGALALGLAGAAGVARAEDLWRTLPAPAPLPFRGSSGYAAHDGARIFWRSYGAGSPVIMLHGGLANGEYWGNQVPALVRDHHRVILIDSRGHGRSTRDARPYTYELMASDVVAVMDALGVGRAAVVGWSDGAIIALVMALKYPDRLTRAFAFAANMDPSGVRSDTETNPTFARFERQCGGDYQRLSATPGDYAAFQAAIERMWDKEPNYSAADLSRIATPVAIVDGDHDEAIKREHTEYLARSIPGARLIILPGLSHFAMLQNPAVFNAAMLGFLDAPVGLA